MQPRTDALRVVRDLRGAPITILITMWMLGGGGGETQLAEASGYRSVQTVRAALRLLNSYKLITRTHRARGWVLTQGGRQMLLSWSEFLLPVGNSVENLLVAGDNSAHLADDVDNFVDNLAEPVKSTGRPVKNIPVGDLDLVVPIDSNTRGETTRLEAEPVFFTGSVEEALAGLVDDEGKRIEQPMLGKLARLPWMNEVFLARHVEAWQRGRNSKERSIRLLIWRLQHQKEPPLTRAEQDEHDRRRYVEGEYSDLIER